MPPAVTFDTLKFVEKLRARGFAEEQAKGMAEAFQEAQATQLEGLATKTDIQEVKRDIQALELKLEGQLTLIRWMLGILIAGVLSLVLKAFF